MTESREVAGGQPAIKDLEPLVGRWRQVVDAPRHVEEKVEGDMTLEWLRARRWCSSARSSRTRCLPRASS
ncbi:hypothetical protein SAMN04488543_1975 [Friedmanniella luteola]|uniref:Uncharacterized protein n=1 Tax=Friedmanniella luteola TaxID=546871 RepID=A0A1H1TA00_9ACTN|nr:hypothetical protein [Friedmanniella luteola]SDS56973.1 hypothetical protein SAMN04488543_1975 [Friedmanniella luteola]